MKPFSVAPNIAQARTIDTAVYLSPEVFEQGKEAIFAATYQYVGCADEASEAGNAWPFTLLPGCLDEPLLLTQAPEGQWRCLSNVCTHRGNLLVTKPCKLHRLSCKYHGRQFDLAGRFLHMPEFKEVEDFPSEADHLPSLPVFSWGKLLFASLHPALPPERLFGEVMARMAWYPMGALRHRPDRMRRFRVKANWALYCENYLEGFHIPFVHQGLNQVLDFGKYTTELFEYANLQVGIAKEGEPSFDLPFESPDNGKQVAAYYFWVFPNLMLNFYPWGLSLNVVKPLGVAETEVEFHTFVLDEAQYDTGAGSDLDTVELEDEEIVEQVQVGVRSRFYRHGRYSATREQGTHHFHRLLAAFLNGSAS
jgi:choline monooxygenase